MHKITTFDYYMFDEIFIKFYSPLCNYVAKIISDDAMAEDVVQELFIELWQKDNLNQVANIEAYLLRASKFRAIDVLRKSKKSASIVSINEEVVNLTNQESSIDEHEIEPMMVYLLSKLPMKTRQAFELSRIDGFSYKEIADIQGLSIKTIENQIGSALKIIKEALKSLPTIIVFFVNLF